MDVREKLAELLKSVLPNFRNNMAYWGEKPIYEFADCLLANGVTVQEWISVKDRLPEPWKQVLIYSRHDFCESAFYIGVLGKWRVTWNHEMLDADSVTHWMQMPEPPEENDYETD